MHSKKEKKNLRTREGSHGGRCNFRESSHNLAIAVLFVKKEVCRGRQWWVGTRFHTQIVLAF